MFTLYMKWDAGCDLAPADIQFILTPRDALEMASVFYELDYLEYEPCPRYQHLPLPSNGTAFSWIYEPDARRSMHDDDFC